MDTITLFASKVSLNHPVTPEPHHLTVIWQDSIRVTSDSECYLPKFDQYDTSYPFYKMQIRLIYLLSFTLPQYLFLSLEFSLS